MEAYSRDVMYGAPLWAIPRSLADRAGPWDERLSNMADHEYMTRVVLRAVEVRFAAEATYFYRCGRAASLSQARTPEAAASAALATTLIGQHLLAAYDSPAMRRLAANLLQGIVYGSIQNTPI